jgi:hypothetical protein
MTKGYKQGRTPITTIILLRNIIKITAHKHIEQFSPALKAERFNLYLMWHHTEKVCEIIQIQHYHAK